MVQIVQIRCMLLHIIYYTPYIPFLGQSPFRQRFSSLSLPQTSSIKYVQCMYSPRYSIHSTLHVSLTLDLNKWQLVAKCQLSIICRHLVVPLMWCRRHMDLCTARLLRLLVCCHNVSSLYSFCLFMHVIYVSFKSLAGLSSFTYGYQPPHLTPSTSSSWPQSKSAMHACRIFSKVYNII